MIRMLVVLGIAGIACLYSCLQVQGQPTGCQEDIQCNNGFYCARDTFHCRKCLSCEDLKREGPLSSSNCIKYVSDCGPCIKGLVEDHRGDVSSQCVAAEAGALPAYVWAVVALGLLLVLALVALILVYVLRNTYTFKILASTRTSVQSPCNNGNVAATAPELPPPYDAPAPYNPVLATERPVSPYERAYNGDNAEPGFIEDESSWPFMKRLGPERTEGGGGAAREAAGRQAARVYHPPRYVRPPSQPANYDSPAMNEESESTFTIHDEDTMESTWTPAPEPGADHIDTNGNAVGGTQGALVPQSSSLAQHPHPHCSRQDTNNNRNSSEPSVSSGPSFFINVVQNINAVKQHNDVTL